jgi:hypothetical protein
MYRSIFEGSFMRALKRATAIFACFTGLATSVLGAQETPKASILFREFQSPQKTGQATEQLLKLGKSDTKVKKYLAVRLPPVIEKSPQDNPEVWNNAVRLAGELKIAEAAPTLGKWIGLDSGGSITFAGNERLDNNLVGKALALIGDPAVPTLNGVLEHGNSNEREVAVRALKLIGSPRAKSALRGHLKRESDPHVRDLIEQALAG